MICFIPESYTLPEPEFVSNFMSSQPGLQLENYLKPIILPEILQAQKEEVLRVFAAECIKPKEYIHEYDKYIALVSGQAEKDLEHFLREQHSFQDLLAEVINFQQLADQIQYSSCHGGHVSYHILIIVNLRKCYIVSMC